MIPKSIDY